MTYVLHHLHNKLELLYKHFYTLFAFSTFFLKIQIHRLSLYSLTHKRLLHTFFLKYTQKIDYKVYKSLDFLSFGKSLVLVKYLQVSLPIGLNFIFIRHFYYKLPKLCLFRYLIQKQGVVS